MSRLRNLFALLLLVLAFPLLGADAEDRFETKFSKDLAWSGGRVSVEHAFGELTLRTHAGNDVRVRATIRSSDEALGRQIRIVTETNGSGVTVRTDYPEGRIPNVSFSVDLAVVVPTKAVLAASNRFGSIDAQGLHTGASIENRQGSITFHGNLGRHTVTNSFGSIEANGNTGDLTLVNANGSVSVRKLDGALTVTNRFGSISATDVQRDATLTNANGSVEASDIGGRLQVTNAFGSVKASTVRGDADVTTTNARVDLSNVTGGAKITNSFGNVSARSIRGNVTAQSSNGNVTLKDIGGNAGVTSTFGSVFVEGVTGGVSVANANGAISVKGLRGGGCQPLSLKTNFSPIEVVLPAGANYDVDARTSFGQVRSDFPVTTRTFTEGTLAGTLGRGNCRMDLTNANGNITIEKE